MLQPHSTAAPIRYDSSVLNARRSRRFGALIIALALLVGGSTSAVASTWAVVPSPNPPIPTGSLTGVSCADQTNCVAVGYLSGTSGYVAPFAETRSKTGWALQTVPSPAGSTGAYLNGVACTSAAACTAVGYSVNADQTRSPLVEQWNGSEWSIQPAPAAPGANYTQLFGVSCASSIACMAVGQLSRSSPNSGQQVFAESWDGIQWSLQVPPSPDSDSRLAAVACLAADDCIAVGNSTSAFTGTTSTVAMHWDGSEWTILETPNLSGIAQLSAISCTARGSCMAVGFVNSGSATGGVPLTLAEEFDGIEWHVLPTPNPSGTIGAFLNSVACDSDGCTAGGHNEPSSGVAPIVTLAETWDGMAWSISPTPNPTNAVNAVLLGIACPSQTSCVSAGYYGDTGNGPAGTVIRTLVETEGGTTWSITPTPNPTGSLGAAFNGVSCSSASACEAVGYTADASGNYVTLAEVWNGWHWTVQATPSPASRSSRFTAVSCVSSTACLAVGNYFDGNSNSQIFAESFDGSAWTNVPPVTPTGSVDVQLTSISCSAANSCIAVGYYSTTGTNALPLAESWHGASWTIETMPVPTDNLTTFLYSVSCASSSACVTVGLNNTRSSSGPFAEIWNGIAWSIQTTARPLGLNPSLEAVSCWSATACHAVGSFNLGLGSYEPFAETWDGSTWTVRDMPTPNPRLPAQVHSISCTSAWACMAVGSASDSSLKDYTLAEIWGGTAWSIVSTPSPPGPAAALLSSVSCTTLCMAAGRANGVTLVMSG